MSCFRLFCTVAMICCGFSASTFAQDIPSSDISAPSILLAGIQVDSDESPLDFGFAADESQPDPKSLGEEKTTEASSPVDRIIANSQQADRAQQAVRAQPTDRARALTSTAARAGGQVLDGSHFAPLYWSQGSYSHNAMADYMSLQWCSDGLWDTFPAERAAQCALQYERMSGAKRHRCGGCCQQGVHAYSGHCCLPAQHSRLKSGCGCAAGNCGCGKANDCPPINRYRIHRLHGCDSCAPAAGQCEASGCSQCDQGSACDSALHSILSPVDTSSISDAGPASAEPSHESAGKVAFLPLTTNR